MLKRLLLTQLAANPSPPPGAEAVKGGSDKSQVCSPRVCSTTRLFSLGSQNSSAVCLLVALRWHFTHPADTSRVFGPVSVLLASVCSQQGDAFPACRRLCSAQRLQEKCSSSAECPTWKLVAHFVKLCSGESCGENLLKRFRDWIRIFGKP